MYALINKNGIALSVESENTKDQRFNYVEITSDFAVKIRKAQKNGKVVKYVSNKFVFDDPKISKNWDQIRAVRDKKFEEADAALFRVIDAELIDQVDLSDQKKSIAEYRQQLRDITQTFESPDDVFFPDPPFNN